MVPFQSLRLLFMNACWRLVPRSRRNIAMAVRRIPRSSSFLLAGAVSLAIARPVRADRVQEVERIHLEAIGGRERVDALRAMKATGEVIAGGRRMKFNLVAARPNRIRLETEAGARTLVQAYDGHDAPWQFDTGTWPPHYENIPDAAAEVFVADAEFDDPLVGGDRRGYAIDDAGEAPVGDKHMIRLLVTRNLTQTYSILLDPDTYFIVKRIEVRKNPFGGNTHIVTDYGDYRPVDGVLVSHLIAVSVDGQVTQQMKIDAIEPNPKFSEDTFTRPKSAR